MRVMVTGAAGYIGSMLCRHLLSKRYHVIAIDNFRYDNQHAIHGLIGCDNFEVHKIDASLPGALKELLKRVDVVIPLAAIVGAPACEHMPYLARAVNLTQLVNIIKDTSDRQRIIYPNTNSGYGIGSNGTCTEVSPLNPVSVYGETKVAAEKVALHHNNTVVLRLATVCGASHRMRFDLLVNDLTAQLYYHGKVQIFEPGFRRNFVHIMDVVRAFSFMIERYDLEGIYNVGNPDANWTKLTLAHKICDCLELSREAVSVGEGMDPDKRDYIVSNEKILNTGFQFQYPISRAITEVTSLCLLHREEDLEKMRNI